METGSLSPFTVILFLFVALLMLILDSRIEQKFEKLKEVAERTGDSKPVVIYKWKVVSVWTLFIVPVALLFIVATK